MEPITVIATAISSLKTATEIATLLKTSDETFIKAELKLKLADLMNALADAKISIAELKDIIQEKDDQISELIKKVENKDNDLVFKNGAYYTSNGDGPFCTNCYDTKKMKVRLTDMPPGFTDFGKSRCPNCEALYQ